MNVIVIGAGIIGMFVSYYLTRDGHTVTLVDGSSTVEKTSIYNGGLITPSSVPAPSFSLMRIVSASIRQVGPIYISPRQFLKNMKWFLPVLREGTEGLGEVMLDLGVRSLELYQDFFRQESIDADLTKGMLTLYGNAEHAEEAARTLKGRFINRSEIYGVGFRDNIRESRKRWLLDVAREHLANYNSLIFVEEGVGYRPCTPDHLPLMGRVPGYDNLYIASGHCRLGVTLAPVTGHIMSSLISGKRFSNVKLESFDPSRFKN
jgi:glycine/D-amino acid oxidase-like deaminating enzyme